MEMSLLLLLIPLTAIFVLVLFLTMVFEKTVQDRLRAIRSIYLYTVSLVSLVVFLFGLGTLVYTGLSHSIFPKALEQNYSYRYMNCDAYPAKLEASTGTTMTAEDKAQCLAREEKAIADEKEARFQGNMLNGIIMIVIAFPVYFVHFVILRKREG